MIELKQLTIQELFEVSDLAEKIKYSDMNKKKFLLWCEYNKEKLYTFIDKDKDEKIIAFMILKIIEYDMDKQILIHSIYVPSELNGVSKKFHKKMCEFAKYMNIKKARIRMLRKPEGMIRKWGFELESYNLTKEIR